MALWGLQSQWSAWVSVKTNFWATQTENFPYAWGCENNWLSNNVLPNPKEILLADHSQL